NILNLVFGFHSDKSAQCAVPSSSEAIYLTPYKPSSAEKINFGTVLKYKCKTDVKNTKESTCVSGKWLPEIECKPKEIKKQCPPPPQVPGALKVTEMRNYESGEEIAFQCLENFEASPSMDKILCEDGKWQSPPRCVEARCGPPPEVVNADIIPNENEMYLPGARVQYKCHRGFRSVGSKKVICENREWSQPPTCEEGSGTCGPPPITENGDITTFPLPRYEPDSTVTYKCKNLYIMKGSQYATCNSGQWTEPPTCIEPCTASEQDMAENNIRLRWASGEKLYSPSGDVIEFECIPGYVRDPASPPFRVQCLEGKLPYPRCKLRDVRCRPPPEVVNADIIPTENEMYLPGTRVQYKCHRGFRSVGSNQVICENREWSQPPTCQDVTCGSPPDIANGWIAEIKRERYFPGEIIHYRCRQGQTLTGPARIVCKEGNWSPPGTPECN
ncbi:complement factor H-like, partial [Alligator sinensis]|uniref:Complement factor H-like n=1 Tax=Alligator sinensis TaxID=38654 RepID=A0A3Q0FW52_ALLSI